MENELNLVELLKDAPEGTKLYSPVCGECELVYVKSMHPFPIQLRLNNGDIVDFSKSGNYYLQGLGECLLFPSKDNRDWSTFKVEESFKVGDHVVNKETGEAYFLALKKSTETKGFWAKRVVLSSPLDACEIFISEFMFDEYKKIEKFHSSLLKPFGMVLMRDTPKSIWFATFFSHLSDRYKNEAYVANDGCSYTYCIPYNSKTKDLLGTDNEEPDFYKKDL